MRTDRLGILAAGGPAPGINSVIAAAAIRARFEGLEVVGIRDGFRWIKEGDISQVVELTHDNVAPIHFRGGSFIGIHRANPAREGKLEATLDSLMRLGIDKLICIGGDGTAASAMRLRDMAGDRLRVVHVPKTIDNDLPLEPDVPAFGFQTARHVGVGIVENLGTDAETTSRWYFVVTQGRQAGHLALGIGKAASATLTLIPEEFPTKVRLSRLVDILTGAIVKRLSQGKSWGVAVLAEGLINCVEEADIADELRAAGHNEHGAVLLTEVNLGQLLKDRVLRRLTQFPSSGDLALTIKPQNVGYELRCTDPIPFDLEYTRDLGYSATKYLLEGGDSAMVSIQRGRFVAIPFEAMFDPKTMRTRVRNVDRDSESYKIALRYMTRIRRDDFKDDEKIARMAGIVGLSSEEFRSQFEYVVEGEPPALRFL